MSFSRQNLEAPALGMERSRYREKTRVSCSRLQGSCKESCGEKHTHAKIIRVIPFFRDFCNRIKSIERGEV